MTIRETIEKCIEIKPTVVDDEPDAHNVFLQITNQRFCVTRYACETKDDAEWFKDQLCVALEKLVRACGEKEKE